MNLRRPLWTLPLMGTLFAGAMFPRSSRADDVSYLARNEAIELTVSGVRMADRYGPLQPPEGRKFLVLSTEWRNLLGETPIAGKLMPTPYVVPALDQQLFLVVNSGRTAPFA